MKLRNLVRSLVTVGAATALCTLAAPAYAASAAPATSTSAAISCPSGDVCLALANGTVKVVPGGKGSWSPPLHVLQIDNNTSVTSCVEIAIINYLPVPKHTIISGNWMVYSVEPGPVCP